MEQNVKRVLIAPLDWGLGHATRCVPIIRELKRRGHDVVLAAQGKPARVLSSEFPGIEIVPIVNYAVSYASHPWLLYLKFPWLLLKVFLCAARENRQLNHIIHKHDIHVVISDNRFGCHSKNARCVYISHQLTVLMPKGFSFLEPLFWWGHRQVTKKYDELWIPDVPQKENLTGDLTRKYPLPLNSRFIGLLSRFNRHTIVQDRVENLDLLVMISGPEPSRSQFEKVVLAQLKNYHGRVVILAGDPSHTCGRKGLNPGVILKPHASTEEIIQLLLSAKAIICRGGYTTIMELVSLNKKAVLVPTPGQTEQRYLCQRLQSMGYCVMYDQNAFNLEKALDKLSRISTPCSLIPPYNLLNSAIDTLVSKIER
ncbi:MAG: hypothetical protein GF401_13470 [Chitinivibrionales bacterium]|nr:hypothetical protein [Chitinivibrionales bacterium]